MSKGSFQTGHLAFRSVICKITPLIEPSSPLRVSCRIAGVQFPFGPIEATAFSKRSVSCLKKKADLLSSLLPMKLKRTKLLDLAANICFFDSWGSFQSFAESFPKLSPSQRESSGDSFKFSMPLWQLTENRLDEFVKSCASGSANILSEITGLPNDECKSIVLRIYTNDELAKKAGHIRSGEMIEISSLLYEDPLAHHLMAILSCPLVAEDSLIPWPDLKNFSLGELLMTNVLYEQGEKAITLNSLGLLKANVMSSIHEYAATGMCFYMNPVAGLDNARKEEQRLLSGLANVDSNKESEKAVAKLIESKINKPVFDLVTRKRNESGLLSNSAPLSLYLAECKYGTPFSIINCEGEDLSIYIFESEPFSIVDNTGCGVKNFCALLSDKQGNTAGFAELFFAHNPSGRVYDLGMLCDEIEVPECVESNITMALEIGKDLDGKLRKLIYLTSWEVAQHHQRKGYGKKLLTELFDHTISKNGKPDLVLARIHPAKFPVPAIDDSNFDLIPNYSKSLKETNLIWHKVTKGGTKFGRHTLAFHPARFSKICHGHSNLRMGAMAIYHTMFI